LIFVAFLLPLALYCLALGLINRRQHPLIVSAGWDFAGLMFAASGFLAFGLPGLLSGFSEHGRRLALFGRPPDNGSVWAWFRALFDGLCATLFAAGSTAVLLAYFVVVVAGCAVLLWRRQGQTAIYNVDADVLEEILAGAFDAVGLTWWRAGSRYFLARAIKDQPPPLDVGSEQAVGVREHLPPPQRPGRYPVVAEDVERCTYLHVDAAPLLCHATLRWETEDESLRKQVEEELARAFAEVYTRHNAMAAWLLMAGVMLFFASLSTCAWVAIAVFLER
jgi:hypothetical protein